MAEETKRNILAKLRERFPAEQNLEPIVSLVIAELQSQDISPDSFGRTLGFGGATALRLDELVDPLLDWKADADAHVDCARECLSCGLMLADRLCEDCSGSGGTVISGAWSECELCGGIGKIHSGCEQELNRIAELESFFEAHSLQQIDKD